MATDFRPAIDGPRGREKSGESANDHFSGNKHTGFQGSTPEIRNAVQQFNADRKAGKDTTTDRAAVLKAQEAHAAKAGMSQRAENRLQHLESLQKSGATLNQHQQDVESRLQAVSKAAKPATPSSGQSLGSFKSAEQRLGNVGERIEAEARKLRQQAPTPKPQANGAGS